MISDVKATKDKNVCGVDQKNHRETVEYRKVSSGERRRGESGKVGSDGGILYCCMCTCMNTNNEFHYLPL